MYTFRPQCVYILLKPWWWAALNLKWVKYWPARAGVDDASINFIFVICQLQRGSSARSCSALSQASARALVGESRSSLGCVSREFREPLRLFNCTQISGKHVPLIASLVSNAPFHLALFSHFQLFTLDENEENFLLNVSLVSIFHIQSNTVRFYMLLFSLKF